MTMKDKVVIPQYGRHSASAFVPFDKKAVGAIVDSMNRNGFLPQFPILLAPDSSGSLAVVDGWHRYQAAKEVGVEPVFKKVDEYGLDENGSQILAYAVAANISRRQMNSKRQVLALMRSGLKGLDEATIMKMTGSSSSTVRGGMDYYRHLSPKQQKRVIDETMSTKEADSAVKAKRGTTNTHRSPKTAPPALSMVLNGQMQLAADLEGVTWMKAWTTAASLWVEQVMQKHGEKGDKAKAA